MADAKKGKVFDFAALSARGGKNRAVIFGAVAVAVFLGAGWVLRSHKDIPESKIGGVSTSINATAGGLEQKTSPDYQQSVERANDQSFKDAMQTGKTNLPIVERPVDPLTPPAPTQEQAWKNPVARADAPPPPMDLRLPQASLPQAAPVRVEAAPAAPAPAKDMSNDILEEMKALAAAWTPRSAAVVELKPPAGTGDSAAAAKVSDGKSATGSSKEKARPIVPAGSILYGSTLTATDSDAVGSPVVMTIDAGPFRSSRLIGGFTVPSNATSMVVKFTLMSLPTGESVPVSAYAVDGQTASTAVASDVDQRYLSRYGPVLGAAFVAGFGQAAAQVGTTQTSTASSTTISQATPTIAQALAAGGSSAAASIAGDLLARAPKGPLVKLAADYPMAVLFTDNVYPPGSTGADRVAESNASAAEAALKTLGERQRAINGQTAGDGPPPQPLVQGYSGQNGMRVFPTSGLGGGTTINISR